MPAQKLPLFIFLLLFLALIACGRGDDSNNGTPVNPGYIDLDELIDFNAPPLPIRWGLNTNYLLVNEGRHDIITRYEDAAVPLFLNEKFNVQIAGVYTPDIERSVSADIRLYSRLIEMLAERGELPPGSTCPLHLDEQYRQVLARINGHEILWPDIFMSDVKLMHQTGFARTIPEDMIRRYAPNYAALLDRHNGWGVSQNAHGEQTALNTFNYGHRDVNLFSVYRLDWLEAHGFALPGPVTQIAEGVYFSANSYMYHDFLMILDAFTQVAPNPLAMPDALKGIFDENLLNQAAERTWAAGINGAADIFRAVAPVLGMFGVNTSIVEENGLAIPYFASQNYKNALIFLQDLAQRGSIINHSLQENYSMFTCYFVRVGWSAVQTQDLYRVVNTAASNDPTRRFLITPPENGGTNMRGVGLAQNSSSFNPDGRAWVIPYHVSDNTLSRILNMFDEMAFNPEIYSIVTYGRYDESPFFNEIAYSSRFKWNGEPYRSTIDLHRTPAFIAREGVFFTGIIDGHTFPQRLLGEFTAVSQFAQSDAGRALNIFPAREDSEGKFHELRADLDSQFKPNLYGGIRFDDETYMWHFCAVSMYILNVLTGYFTVADTWDDYMNDLYANGLQSYIDLFSSFPMNN
jgi:hypothetical protein